MIMHYYRYTHAQIFITVHFYSAGNLLPSNDWIKEVAVPVNSIYASHGHKALYVYRYVFS